MRSSSRRLSSSSTTRIFADIPLVGADLLDGLLRGGDFLRRLLLVHEIALAVGLVAGDALPGLQGAQVFLAPVAVLRLGGLLLALLLRLFVFLARLVLALAVFLLLFGGRQRAFFRILAGCAGAGGCSRRGRAGRRRAHHGRLDAGGRRIAVAGLAVLV